MEGKNLCPYSFLESKQHRLFPIARQTVQAIIRCNDDDLVSLLNTYHQRKIQQIDGFYHDPIILSIIIHHITNHSKYHTQLLNSNEYMMSKTAIIGGPQSSMSGSSPQVFGSNSLPGGVSPSQQPEIVKKVDHSYQRISRLYRVLLLIIGSSNSSQVWFDRPSTISMALKGRSCHSSWMIHVNPDLHRSSSMNNQLTPSPQSVCLCKDLWEQDIIIPSQTSSIDGVGTPSGPDYVRNYLEQFQFTPKTLRSFMYRMIGLPPDLLESTDGTVFASHHLPEVNPVLQRRMDLLGRSAAVPHNISNLDRSKPITIDAFHPSQIFQQQQAFQLRTQSLTHRQQLNRQMGMNGNHIPSIPEDSSSLPNSFTSAQDAYLRRRQANTKPKYNASAFPSSRQTSSASMSLEKPGPMDHDADNSEDEDGDTFDVNALDVRVTNQSSQSVSLSTQSHIDCIIFFNDFLDYYYIPSLCQGLGDGTSEKAPFLSHPTQQYNRQGLVNYHRAVTASREAKFLDSSESSQAFLFMYYLYNVLLPSEKSAQSADEWLDDDNDNDDNDHTVHPPLSDSCVVCKAIMESIPSRNINNNLQQQSSGNVHTSLSITKTALIHDNHHRSHLPSVTYRVVLRSIFLDFFFLWTLLHQGSTVSSHLSNKLPHASLGSRTSSSPLVDSKSFTQHQLRQNDESQITRSWAMLGSQTLAFFTALFQSTPDAAYFRTYFKLHVMILYKTLLIHGDCGESSDASSIYKDHWCTLLNELVLRSSPDKVQQHLADASRDCFPDLGIRYLLLFSSLVSGLIQSRSQVVLTYVDNQTSIQDDHPSFLSPVATSQVVHDVPLGVESALPARTIALLWILEWILTYTHRAVSDEFDLAPWRNFQAAPLLSPEIEIASTATSLWKDSGPIGQTEMPLCYQGTLYHVLLHVAQLLPDLINSPHQGICTASVAFFNRSFFIPLLFEAIALYTVNTSKSSPTPVVDTNTQLDIHTWTTSLFLGCMTPHWDASLYAKRLHILQTITQVMNSEQIYTAFALRARQHPTKASPSHGLWDISRSSAHNHQDQQHPTRGLLTDFYLHFASVYTFAFILHRLLVDTQTYPHMDEIILSWAAMMQIDPQTDGDGSCTPSALEPMRMPSKLAADNHLNPHLYVYFLSQFESLLAIIIDRLDQNETQGPAPNFYNSFHHIHPLRPPSKKGEMKLFTPTCFKSPELITGNITPFPLYVNSYLQVIHVTTIGAGACGKVEKILIINKRQPQRKDWLRCAAKVYEHWKLLPPKDTDRSPEVMQLINAIEREISMLLIHSSPGSVPLLAMVPAPGSTLLITPLGFSDLLKLMGNRWSRQTIAFLAFQILVGLFYFHANGFVHGDIKPDNVLVMPNGHIKLTDLGCAHTIHAFPLAQHEHGEPPTPSFLYYSRCHDRPLPVLCRTSSADPIIPPSHPYSVFLETLMSMIDSATNYNPDLNPNTRNDAISQHSQWKETVPHIYPHYLHDTTLSRDLNSLHSSTNTSQSRLERVISSTLAMARLPTSVMPGKCSTSMQIPHPSLYLPLNIRQSYYDSVYPTNSGSCPSIQNANTHIILSNLASNELRPLGTLVYLPPEDLSHFICSNMAGNPNIDLSFSPLQPSAFTKANHFIFTSSGTVSYQIGLTTANPHTCSHMGGPSSHGAPTHDLYSLGILLYNQLHQSSHLYNQNPQQPGNPVLDRNGALKVAKWCKSLQLYQSARLNSTSQSAHSAIDINHASLRSLLLGLDNCQSPMDKIVYLQSFISQLLSVYNEIYLSLYTFNVSDSDNAGDNLLRGIYESSSLIHVALDALSFRPHSLYLGSIPSHLCKPATNQDTMRPSDLHSTAPRRGVRWSEPDSNDTEHTCDDAALDSIIDDLLLESLVLLLLHPLPHFRLGVERYTPEDDDTQTDLPIPSYVFYLPDIASVPGRFDTSQSLAGLYFVDYSGILSHPVFRLVFHDLDRTNMEEMLQVHHLIDSQLTPMINNIALAFLSPAPRQLREYVASTTSLTSAKTRASQTLLINTRNDRNDTTPTPATFGSGPISSRKSVISHKTNLSSQNWAKRQYSTTINPIPQTYAKIEDIFDVLETSDTNHPVPGSVDLSDSDLFQHIQTSLGVPESQKHESNRILSRQKLMSSISDCDINLARYYFHSPCLFD